MYTVQRFIIIIYYIDFSQFRFFQINDDGVDVNELIFMLLGGNKFLIRIIYF